MMEFPGGDLWMSKHRLIYTDENGNDTIIYEDFPPSTKPATGIDRIDDLEAQIAILKAKEIDGRTERRVSQRRGNSPCIDFFRGRRIQNFERRRGG